MKGLDKIFTVFKPKYLALVACGVILDLITKYWAIQYLDPRNSKEVWGDFFRLSLVFNTGFVFGFFQNNMGISIVTTTIAVVVLFYYRISNPELGHPAGWYLVLTGAFGNLIDKFFIKMPPGGGFKFGLRSGGPGEYIGVVDFLDFDWPDWLIFNRWPAFNVADSCVTVGLLLLILTMNKVYGASQNK